MAPETKRGFFNIKIVPGIKVAFEKEKGRDCKKKGKIQGIKTLDKRKIDKKKR